MDKHKKVSSCRDETFFESIETTASQSVSEDDVKEIRISDNNIYESGVDGIFEVLDKKLNLPEKLFMQNDFILNFDSKGDITSFKTLIYGVKKDGNLESYDINYSSKESNKIKVVLGTEVGANYDEAKLIEPLKLIAKNVPLRDQANKSGTKTELFETSNSGETFKEVELPDRSVSGIENANEIFDTPEVPTVEDGGLSMLIGQGHDGDYNGGSKLKFMSYNLGSTWKFVGEIKK